MQIAAKIARRILLSFMACGLCPGHLCLSSLQAGLQVLSPSLDVRLLKDVHVTGRRDLMYFYSCRQSLPDRWGIANRVLNKNRQTPRELFHPVVSYRMIVDPQDVKTSERYRHDESSTANHTHSTKRDPLYTLLSRRFGQNLSNGRRHRVWAQVSCYQ